MQLMNEVRKKDRIGEEIYAALVAVGTLILKGAFPVFFAKCDVSQ